MTVGIRASWRVVDGDIMDEDTAGVDIDGSGNELLKASASWSLLARSATNGYWAHRT